MPLVVNADADSREVAVVVSFQHAAFAYSAVVATRRAKATAPEARHPRPVGKSTPLHLPAARDGRGDHHLVRQPCLVATADRGLGVLVNSRNGELHAIVTVRFAHAVCCH